jgi:hypothetical protein
MPVRVMSPGLGGLLMRILPAQEHRRRGCIVAAWTYV